MSDHTGNPPVYWLPVTSGVITFYVTITNDPDLLRGDQP